MGTTQRTKSNGFLALPAAQKSASSTGGSPSGEFGARNSPRAGPNHPRGVRTEYNRRLARRRPPGGAAPPTRVRGEWCWVWCTGARCKSCRRRQGTGGRAFGPSRGRTELTTSNPGGVAANTSFEMGLSCPLSCGKAVWQPGSTYKVDLSQSDHPRTQTADPHRLKMSRLTAIWSSSAYITRIRGSTCLEVAVRAVGCGQRISGMQEIASRGHCLPRVNWGWV